MLARSCFPSSSVFTSGTVGQRAMRSFRRRSPFALELAFHTSATMTSSASSGNNALKLSFTVDYTLSKMLTMSFYYDRQTNTPLLSSSSYPTTTQDFGLSIKFSLTR